MPRSRSNRTQHLQVGLRNTMWISECRSHVAGTNFLTRSIAFEQAGWSPEYTLTEDYALGMELRKRKWKCRYVEEYLAVGEAPEQVRNCFQQRSRWAKVRIFSSSPMLIHCSIGQDKVDKVGSQGTAACRLGLDVTGHIRCRGLWVLGCKDCSACLRKVLRLSSRLTLLETDLKN